MSQSMARKLSLNGFGSCVTYGEANDVGIGLPIEIDENTQFELWGVVTGAVRKFK